MKAFKLFDKDNIKTRIFGGLLSILAAAVVYNEGTGIGKDGKAKAYKDSAGIWTVCSGTTYGVNEKTIKTPKECAELLNQDLKRHSTVVYGLPIDLKDTAILGFIDFGYNVGIAAARNSTVYKELAKSNYTAAGAAVLSWKYITIKKNGKPVKFDCSTPNNKVCSGLWNRRRWQADTIAGKYSTALDALVAMPKYY